MPPALIAFLAAIQAAISALLASVSLDQTASPSVSLVADPPIVTAAGPVVLTATATDAVGVTSLLLYRGSALIAVLPATGGVFTDHVGEGASGNVTYKAVAQTARKQSGSQELLVPVAIPVTPVPTTGLSNNGDAFTWAYAPYTGGGTITSYRTYSLRSAGAISRVLIAETPTAQPVVDNTVADGAVAWYKTYMVVGGQEMLVDSAMDTQPIRSGWIASQLVIAAPGTYVLRHRNTDRSRSAVKVNSGVTGVFLVGLMMSAGNGIDVGAGAEVTVTDVRGWGLHPGVADSAHGKFINGAQAKKIVVQRCYTEDWLFSVYNDGQQEGSRTTTLQTFRLLNNNFRNCEGRRTTATGYVLTGDSRAPNTAHFVQINGCSAIGDAEIAHNLLIQEAGRGYVEDPVNIYNSSCVAGNWGKIHSNMIYGGYAPNSIASRGYAGVGIIFDGLSSGVQYWRAYSNSISGVSNGGIGVPHGYDIDIYDNDIVCSGYLEDGTLNWATNIGIYAYDYVAADPIKRIKVYNNRSRIYRPAGSVENAAGPGRVGNYVLNKHGVDGCEMSYANNAEPVYASLTPGQRMEAERSIYRDWLTGAMAAGQSVGPMTA